MCGIVAQFSKNTTINANEFDKAIKTLTHRGPDEYDHTLSFAVLHKTFKFIDL